MKRSGSGTSRVGDGDNRRDRAAMSRSPSRLERGYYGRGGCGDPPLRPRHSVRGVPRHGGSLPRHRHRIRWRCPKRSSSSCPAHGSALRAARGQALEPGIHAFNAGRFCVPARETIETFPPLPRMVAGSLRLQPAETGDVERDHGQARTPTRASSVALESGRPDDNFSRVGDAS